MRTTLNIDDGLIEEAQRATGIQVKTQLIERGLEALIEEAARKRLAALGGTISDARRVPRRRPSPRRS
jgi:Arc/MetJ family transcription regulator